MEKNNNNYETVIVVSVENSEEEIKAIVEKFKTLIEDNATINNIDEWGKRTLAYEINKEQVGYYILFDFTSGADFPAELERILNITDGILRHLTIRKED